MKVRNDVIKLTVIFVSLLRANTNYHGGITKIISKHLELRTGGENRVRDIIRNRILIWSQD